MSWAPSPKSAARTKGAVHLRKSLLDFHLSLEQFCFVQTSLHNVPIPKEKQKKARISVVVRPCATQSHRPKGEEFGNPRYHPSSLLGSEGSEETLSHGGAEGLAASLEQELLELVLCLCIHSDLQADAKTEQLSSCQSAPTARALGVSTHLIRELFLVYRHLITTSSLIFFFTL